MSGDLGLWIVLGTLVGSMLALDLLVLHRHPKPVPFRQAAAWSAVWISLALSFGVLVAVARGGESGGEYLAGYLIELSLSVDNVFVFALLFTAFAVPAAYQHRLLFWGILGAVVFRALFIAAGSAVLAAAHWVIYLLGVLLVITGIRLARSRGHEVDPGRNPVLRLFRRFVPMTADYRGASFIVREGGRRIATPLLAVLVAIETTDIMFALDSIPAVFAVTTDPLIVFSSNLFAILGLRSLYFLLAGLLDRFVFLKLGLAALLVFAGGKILVSEFYEVPIAASLTIIVIILAGAIGTSLLATHPRRRAFYGPLLRIGAGTGLGAAGLGLFGFAAAIRDGATWPAIATIVGVVVAAGAVLAAGIAGIRRGVLPAIAESAVRIASGVLLGVIGLAVIGGAALARELEATWVLVDAAIVAAAAALVAIGYAGLRRLRVAASTSRGWAALGAALLVMLTLFIALD